MIRTLSRRAVLRGLGGAAISLPLLEIMLDRRAEAQAAGARRFLVVFGGVSTGPLVAPKMTGANYDLGVGLTSLGGRQADPLLPYDSVQSEFSIVSGLRIPTGSPPPVAGRQNGFHSSHQSPLLSGVRSNTLNDGPLGHANAKTMGPSSDQLVMPVLSAGTKFPSLEYRAQPEVYREPDPNKGIMSWKKDAAGAVVPNPPMSSPKVAFDQLFRGFVPGDPAGAARQQALAAQDKSVLDLVKNRSQRLMSKLGAEDQQRLQRHFEEIRQLEIRISQIGSTVDASTPVNASCKPVADPGTDPSVAVTGGASRGIGWANEEARSQIMADMIAQAFICDLTRVASFMLTYAQCFVSGKTICGNSSDLHEIGHGAGTTTQMAQIVSWHLKFVAGLADKLRSVQEPDGNILSKTAIVFLTEGGWANDPHSTEAMIVAIGGRAGGLKPGKHIIAAGKHPASVVLSAMKAVGYQGVLGEVTTDIPELFV
jgi:hypothetical protein